MKFAAVVPALFVLISLCGSPVPAPPGSVSGVAFYDANRNGIHDSCDRPLALATFVATAADGKTETSTSSPDGTFHIDKVDPGLAVIALKAPDGEVWHTTTVTAGGALGVSVEVKDLRDTGGVEIGATNPRRCPPRRSPSPA